MATNTNPKPYLSERIFKTVVDSTPLVSIDFVIRNEKNEILLGLRNNCPAQGFWFVPGGRIYKNETIENAFKRLTKTELGLEVSITDSKYLGLYEHFYNDSVFDKEISGKLIYTHYVVNGFEIKLSDLSVVAKEKFMHLPKDQHDEYIWLGEEYLLSKDNVHIHSKWYFNKEKGFI